MHTIDGFGMRLRTRREELKMSRDALSEKMTESGSGAHRETIKSWESGKPCSISFIPALCKALDCDTEFLFGNSPTPHKEIADASETTGLSFQAIEVLHSMHANEIEPSDANAVILKMLGQGDYYKSILATLNAAIESEAGNEMVISAMSRYVNAAEVSSGFYRMNKNGDLIKSESGFSLVIDDTNGFVDGVVLIQGYYFDILKERLSALRARFHNTRVANGKH